MGKIEIKDIKSKEDSMKYMEVKTERVEPNNNHELDSFHSDLTLDKFVSERT